MIKEYELDNQIIFLNNIKREDLPTVYNALDVFVFPTKRKSESLGLVGLESFACGTLTITSDARGPMSYAKDKKNSYVFKQDDFSDLAKVIDTVCNLSDTAKEKIIKNARKTSLEYDSAKMDNILKKAFK